ALWDEEWRTWRPGGSASAHSSRAYEQEDLPGRPSVSKDERDEDVDVDMTVLMTQGMLRFDDEVDKEAEGWTGNQEPVQAPEEDKGDDVLEDFDADDERFESGAQQTEEDIDAFFAGEAGAQEQTAEFTLPKLAETTEVESPPASDDDDCPRPSKRRRVRMDDITQIIPGSAHEPESSLPSSDSFTRTIRPSLSLSLSRASFDATPRQTRQFVYAIAPPTVTELLDTVDDYRIPTKIYRSPYYSKASDAPDHPREFAGLVYHLKGGSGLATLSEWDTGLRPAQTSKNDGSTGRIGTAPLFKEDVWGWEYAGVSPSPRTCRQWLRAQEAQGAESSTTKVKFRSQIEGPTQANIYGLEASPGDAGAYRERQNMSMFSLEVLVPTRGHLLPSASEDPIAAVLYCYQREDGQRTPVEILVVDGPQVRPERLRDLRIRCVDTELDLLNAVVDTVVDLDPDIIAGWEAQTQSWGYLVARGNDYGLDIPDLMGRAPPRRAASAQGLDRWGLQKGTTIKVPGRHVLNIWRLMRTELTLSIYSFENVAFQVLRRRVPAYSHATLTRWYNSEAPRHTAQALRYLAERTLMDLEILEESEVITKNAEFARVFGVDFYSVLTRGSQFKVESFMFRLAKPESYVLLSPSKIDVGKQNAAECMPLIMEPTSAFYSSPLLVLDFQVRLPPLFVFAGLDS
ncbi:ribonuclease H-like domain-containing protein, partial [Schizophyllum fasciatum]